MKIAFYRSGVERGQPDFRQSFLLFQVIVDERNPQTTAIRLPDYPG